MLFISIWTLDKDHPDRIEGMAIYDNFDDDDDDEVEEVKEKDQNIGVEELKEKESRKKGKESLKCGTFVCK